MTENVIRFRPLQKEEVEARVAAVTGRGAQILIYKDARTDLNILDETFGAFGWKREHVEIHGNVYCGISVRNPETGEWVCKWDCGEGDSKTGSSDSFKRAATAWGIGRGLYTAPFIWLPAKKLGVNITARDAQGAKKEMQDALRFRKFAVSDIQFSQGTTGEFISYLEIADGESGEILYAYQSSRQAMRTKVNPEVAILKSRILEAGMTEEKILSVYKGEVSSLEELCSVKALFEDCNARLDDRIARLKEKTALKEVLDVPESSINAFLESENEKLEIETSKEKSTEPSSGSVVISVSEDAPPNIRKLDGQKIKDIDPSVLSAFKRKNARFRKYVAPDVLSAIDEYNEYLDKNSDLS